MLGCKAKLEACLTEEPEVPNLIPATVISPLPLSQEGQLSVTNESMGYLILANHIGDLSLPRNRVISLTDCPDMTRVKWT